MRPPVVYCNWRLVFVTVAAADIGNYILREVDDLLVLRSRLSKVAGIKGVPVSERFKFANLFSPQQLPLGPD